MDIKSRRYDGNITDDVGKSICRDFLRNVCHRGRRCKYKHPSNEELDEVVDVSTNGIAYEFCHDFQNTQCQRSNCRFIHCTKEVEDHYLITKTLPRRLKYQYDFGIGDCFVGQDKILCEDHPKTGDNRPICRDYLNQDCHRGKKCKFAHIDQVSILAAKAEKGLEIQHEGGIKRPRIVIEDVENRSETSEYCNLRSNQAVVNCLSNSKLLEEENQSLKKRVQELEKQVSDLAATNEVLLEQNAQFRLEKRGITTYGYSPDVMVPSSFTPAIVHSSPATDVYSNPAHPIPAYLNVQVTGQPPVPEMTEFITSGQAPAPRGVVAPAPLHQGSVSVPQTSDIAQVIAANLAVNSDGKVEVIPGTNQVVPIQQGNPQLAPLAPQPIASFSNPVQTPHNQLVQPPMASFAPCPPGPTQIVAQQPVSFSGPIMASAIGGRCAIQTASVSGDIRQSSVGSMVPAVPLPQPTLVYTVTRTTDNMPLVSSIVPASGHEMALVADRSCNSVSSMHLPPQAFNTSQALVQPPSRPSIGECPHPPPSDRPYSEIVSALACAPMTSAIGAANKQHSPAVSRGSVHPVVQNNHVQQSPRVKGGQRGVVQGASSLSDPSMITYPINAVPQAQLHN